MSRKNNGFTGINFQNISCYAYRKRQKFSDPELPHKKLPAGTLLPAENSSVI